ncbi:MAG: M15 family metallopeptidase [Chloroflexi bacterium]|nr:M15 family metallopeptidase [Chloroflexota bacterium]
MSLLHSYYPRRPVRSHLLLLGLLALLLMGCQPATDAVAAATAVPTNLSSTSTSTAVALPTPTTAPPTTPTAVSTATNSPTPVATHTPTVTPTATPIPACTQRVPHDDLLTLVTLTYGLSRDYEPQDLVAINDYFGVDVTLGYPNQLREAAIEPLVAMVTDMLSSGLKPQIISGYRSYYSQSIAYNKWFRLNPESAAIVSAPPGHSEHQLGTAVDFGSPELPDVVGQEDIEFHTYFFKTSEGIWLLENAHRYGFTLSYSREAFELTGFYYEPWHYRYIGVEMATQLKEMGMTLTEYQLISQPEPCIPEDK